MFLIVHSASKAFNDAKNVSTSTQPYEFARQREEEEEEYTSLITTIKLEKYLN